MGGADDPPRVIDRNRKTRMPSPLTLTCADLAATGALAARLAPHLRAGDAVLLDGPLAAGKTAFVAALAGALGSHAPIASPSYVIAHIHPGPPLDIIHVDAWRLEGPDAFQDLGLEEAMAGAVTLIEWGSRVADAVPGALHMALALDPDDENRRHVTLRAEDARWHPVLAALVPAAPGGGPRA